MDKPKAGMKSTRLSQFFEEEKKEFVEFIKPVDDSIKDKLRKMAKNGHGFSHPCLITLDLIDKKIKEYREENKIFTEKKDKDKGENYEECREICLSFNNILQISNLDNLVSLEILRLDNNMIMKIEKLDKLVNVKWLDLSFNYISKIEGLDKLVNLTDLSLFANEIEEVTSGLDECRKLNVLSLGKNKISNAKDMTLYLKKFTNLQALCVHFNTFCKDEDSVQKVIEENDTKSQDTFPSSYNIILQHLKYLKYLDWKPLNIETIRAAKSSASSGAGKEEKEDQALKDEEKRKEEAMLRKADLVHIIGFFDDVRKAYRSDISDFDGLLTIRGIEEAINSADKSITDRIEVFKKNCLDLQKQKEEVIRKKSIEQEKNEEFFIEKSKELIRQFKRRLKNYVNEVLVPLKFDANTLTVADIDKIVGLSQLKIDLLEIEVHVKGQNKEFIEKYKSAIDSVNKSLQTEAEKLKNDLDGSKMALKESTQKKANEAKSEYDKYTENLNGEGKDEEKDEEKEPVIVAAPLENQKDDEEYMKKLQELFSGGEVMTDIEKLHETLDEKIGKLKDNLDNDRANSNNIFFADLNNKEYIRNKKRVEDIEEIKAIYEEKIKNYLQDAIRRKNED